jgi:RecJ-like exonuclease
VGVDLGRAEIRRFQRAADEVATFLKNHLARNSRVKIITHTDADGIAAAGILARCLYAYNLPFHIKFTRPLRPAEIAELGKENYDLFAFLDQGSAQISAIHKFVLGAGHDVLILDHHPGEFPVHPNLACLNPHACGLNGAKDVSASGVVYSVIEQIDKSFRPLVGLAVIGALGDRQEFYSGFTGINDTLVKRAVDLGLVGVDEGLKLIGRDLSPVTECLRLSVRPYLPGISGNLDACRELVDTLGIAPSSTIGELDAETEAGLRDALFARVGAVATREEFCHTLWGAVYTSAIDVIAGPSDVREYVAMLDACDRLRKPELGFAVALGDQNACTDTLALLRRYQEQMVRVLGWLATHLERFKTTPQMRYIHVGREIEPGMMGEALSLAMESGLIEVDRPIIGLADTGTQELKISARATPGLAIRGVDVGKALAKVAESMGGTGGGHDVSAAARVPRERMDEFITKLDQAFAKF